MRNTTKNINGLVITINNSNYVDLFVTEVGTRLVLCPKSNARSNQYTAFNRLYYLLSDGCTLEIDNEKTYVGKNDFFVLSPNKNSKLYSNNDTDLISFLYIDFLGTKALEFINRSGLFKNDNTVAKQDTENKKYFEFFSNCINQCQKYADNSNIIALNCLYNIFAELCLDKSSKKSITEAYLNDAFFQKQNIVSKVLEYVSKNYQDSTLSIATIADSMFLSKSYLQHIFSETMNITINNYITYYRIKIASELMANGNILIKDVSFKCGFSDPSYFSKVWKKYNHISPLEHIEFLKQEKK